MTKLPLIPEGKMRDKRPADPIVLAMNDQMQCHAYGPFHSEQDALLWAQVKNSDPSEREYQYTVIALLPASITIRGGRR